MPNHEYVVELIAKGSRLLKETNPTNSMSGYDAASFENFIEQIGCIWNAINTENIKYLTQIFNGTVNGQKIMTVDMIKDTDKETVWTCRFCFVPVLKD